MKVYPIHLRVLTFGSFFLLMGGWMVALALPAGPPAAVPFGVFFAAMGGYPVLIVVADLLHPQAYYERRTHLFGITETTELAVVATLFGSLCVGIGVTARAPPSSDGGLYARGLALMGGGFVCVGVGTLVRQAGRYVGVLGGTSTEADT